MSALRFCVFVLLTPCWAVGQSVPPASQPTPPSAPETVVVPSGNLRLKGFLWRPAGPGPSAAVLFAHGSGSTDAAHTSGFAITQAAEILAPVFVKHGYAFLYLFRRGQGLSADQAPFMQDLLQREKIAHGDEARKRLQFRLLTTDHLDDVNAGSTFLKNLPGIDTHRIAIAGHSFGGQLAILAAEGDSTLRAAVTFGAAAGSWEDSPAIRERLLTAVHKSTVPLMLLHAANDYSTTPGKALNAELTKLGKTHILKIYPPFGHTPDDGHNLVYTAIDEWEPDVFGFLDQRQTLRYPGKSGPKLATDSYLAERFFQRRALRREQLCPVFRDMHVVLKPHSKLAPDVNSRLIAERHIRSQLRGISTHQVGPLVTIHPDPMAQPMSEVFVVRTISSVSDYFAGGGVH